MNEQALNNYCAKTIEKGAIHAKQIDPKSVVTAEWVLLKCRFGCPSYSMISCCPPDTPTLEATRYILDSYNSAILMHKETAKSPEQWATFKDYFKMLVDLEGELFKDGYYKAFVFLAGTCHLCKECNKLRGAECSFKQRARPSMESFGIDV